MVKAGQTGGTEVGLKIAESQLPIAEEIASVPWSPRTDGKSALLVSERATVFDQKLRPFDQDEPAFDVSALGPMPREWTHDMVHCRLVHVDALAQRLPRAKVPAKYRSFLGELQPQDAAPGRNSPLSADEERRLDWTLARLCAWGPIDQAVLMGVMSGRSFEKISKVTFGIARRVGGDGLTKSAVFKRYRRNTTMMAEAWNRLQLPIDDATQKCWLDVASKRFRKR